MFRTWYLTNDWRTYTDRENYATKTMKQGDVVSRVYINGKPMIEKIQDSSSKIPHAISLMDVMDSPFNKENPTIINNTPGSRVEVLERGEIIYRLDNLNLPVNQPIYVDIDNSRLTWRAVGPKVGKLIRPQDEDGFCRMMVDFSKQFE